MSYFDIILFMNKVFKFIPSRIVISLVLVPVFSVISFFTVKDIFISPTEREDIAQEKFISVLKEELTNADGDKDGLQDWEERLYKTDTTKADTDNDGVLDGLEVQLGTDPLDPFNKVSNIEKYKVQELTKEDYRNDSTLTKTDIFARDFLTKTVGLKNAGLINNDSAQKQIITELLDENSEVLVNIYTEADITVKKISDLSFKKNFSEIFIKNSIGNLADDYYLFAMYVDTQDVKYLEEIQKNIEVYESLLNDSLTMPASEGVKVFYVRYINILNQYIISVKQLFKFESDPVAFLDSLKNARDIDKDFRSIMRVFQLYFKEKNI
jgi:hypothetical protein